VADVSGDLRVTQRLKIPASELQWRFSGSGGPGGQHANTSNTKVALTWNAERSEALTDYQRKLVLDALGPVVRVVAVDERSQTRNRDLALERLRERVRSALVVPARRRPTAPTVSSVRRRLTDKRLQSERKTSRRTVEDPEE
jgi:ribosome-associated protein